MRIIGELREQWETIERGVGQVSAALGRDAVSISQRHNIETRQ
jgi:hypothetical protein